ncbi:MAG: hypothetical protein ACTJFR_01750 [Canibacter sp.]
MPTNETAGQRDSSLASGWVVHEEIVAAAPATESDAGAAGPTEVRAAQVSNAAVVLLGVFGGLYLLYTWGWFTIVQVYQNLNLINASASGAVGGVLQYVLFWIIPLAPALWFLCTLWMTWGKPTKYLALWLVLGTIVLMPLPLLLGGGS